MLVEVLKNVSCCSIGKRNMKEGMETRKKEGRKRRQSKRDYERKKGRMYP